MIKTKSFQHYCAKQNVAKFLQFIHKILFGNEILMSIKGRDTIINLQPEDQWSCKRSPET